MTKAIIAQSGGPTAVINSSCCGIIQECAKHNIQVYGAIKGILGVLHENLIDLGKEEKQTIELLRKTPSSALGSCRYKLTEKDYDRILSVLKAHGIDYFFIIGGNDSMDTAFKVNEMASNKNYNLKVIGIPKTVDNDLVITDHCPGYGSVAKWLAIAVRDAGKDTEAIYTSDRVKIIETMGRDSGWITASTALAREGKDDAPHLIYLPERPFEEESFLTDVKEVCKRLGYAIIAVCEGIKDKNGKTLVESKTEVDKDGFGHAQKGGVGGYLCKLIASKLKIKARCDKPGTIQRVSALCASKTDLDEAYLAGKTAVTHAEEGKSGYMVTLIRESSSPYKCKIGLAKLEDVANKKKLLPNNFINKEGNDITEEFLDYVRPLAFEEGETLSKYAKLKRIFIKKLLPEK